MNILTCNAAFAAFSKAHDACIGAADRDAADAAMGTAHAFYFEQIDNMIRTTTTDLSEIAGMARLLATWIRNDGPDLYFEVLAGKIATSLEAHLGRVIDTGHVPPS